MTDGAGGYDTIQAGPIRSFIIGKWARTAEDVRQRRVDESVRVEGGIYS